MDQLNSINSMNSINELKKTVVRQMYIYGIITIINTFLTILSIVLNITDNYTHSHIVMYLFTLGMTVINWCFHFNVYIKIKPIENLSDPGNTQEILKKIGCIGFYDSILNLAWFISAIIAESVLLSDNFNNKEQVFLITELIIILVVSFYNLVMTCRTCNKSYDSANNVNTEILNIIGNV